MTKRMVLKALGHAALDRNRHEIDASKEHPMRTKSRSSRGFTLIELMIAVAIIGILSAIAYPSYLEYVKRGNRADVKAAIFEDAQYLERNFTEYNSYEKCDCDSDGAIDDDVDESLPVTRSPASGTKLYDLALVSDASTFTITATPTTGASMQGDACGSFTYNHLGSRGLSGTHTYTVEQCWNK